MRIHACALELQKSRHPNRIGFVGVLTLVDTPSDKSPSGARGHRVVLTSDAAADALPGLLGMAINFNRVALKHDNRNRIGIITKAYLLGKRLVVRGFIYAKDCAQDIVQMRASKNLGMSYEIHDAKVEDMRQDVWKLVRIDFTGAAVLDISSTAYKGTCFRIAQEVG